MGELLHRLVSIPHVAISMWFGSFAINVLALASPIFVIQVLNRYVTYGVDATLITLLVGVGLAMVFEVLFRRLRGQVVSSAACLHDFKLEQIFAAVMFGSKGDSNQTQGMALRAGRGQAPDIKKASDDLDRVRTLCSADALEAGLDLPFALIFLLILAAISPAIGLITLGVLGLSILLHQTTAWLQSQDQAANRNAQDQRGALTRSLTDAGDGMRLFLPSQWLQNRWTSAASQLLATTGQGAALKSGSAAFGHFLQTGLVVAVMSWGATEVVAGTLQVGDLIGANILAARALGGVNRFSSLFTGLQLAKTAFIAAMQLRKLKAAESATSNFEGTKTDGMDAPVPANLERGAHPHHLSLNSVSLVWPGQSRALLQGLSLDVPPGTIVLIKGKNGSGKTSLIRMLAGLIAPSHGQILVDGVDLRQLNTSDLGQSLCYLPQESEFMEGRVREGLQATHHCETAAMMQALERVGLKPYFDQHPDGLDLKLGALGQPLSAGQRRRLALARALIVDGGVCLIDEPAESLDQQGRDCVVALMSEWAKMRRTLIIAASEAGALSGNHVTIDLDAAPGHQIIWHRTPPPQHQYVQHDKSASNVASSTTAVSFRTPPPKATRKLATTLILATCCIFAALGWAMQFDLTVTSVGLGRVTAGSESFEVQNLEGGIVQEILAEEGQSVARGTALVQLETLANDALLAELSAQKVNLELQIGRWKAELDGASEPYFTEAAPNLLEESQRLYASRRARLRSQIQEQAEIVEQRKRQIEEIEARLRGQEKQAASLSEQITISENLLEQKLIARIEHLKLLQQGEALSGNIASSRAELQQAFAARDEAAARMSAVEAAAREDAQTQLEASNRDLSQTLEQIRRITDSRTRQVLRAPAAGTIKSVHIASVGEVVQPGQTVIELTPEQSKPLVEVQFPVSEVGYLSLGQEVILNLASPDAARFDPIDAQIIHISADSFIDDRSGTPYFKVRLEPLASEFRRGSDSYPLLPGVPILAQALIGSQTVMTYLAGPFLSSGRLALSER